MINVEYNQLDPLLRASGYPDGDVNNETGYSPFPGNINQVYAVQKLFYISLLYYLRLFNSVSIIIKKKSCGLDYGLYSTFASSI